jgi:carboxymethylenebutenolidase
MHRMTKIAALAVALSLAPSALFGQPRAVTIASPVAVPGVTWTEVTLPDLGTLRLATARPAGAGPFPTVIVLHGTQGFAREYAQVAAALAGEGVLAVAACWFAGGGGEGASFVTPLGCPGAPAMPAAASDTTFATLDVLVRTVRALPEVRQESITLLGHSRGGGAALNYALKGGQVTAAVLESTGYTDEQLELVAPVTTAFLILHGAGDTAADGGSEFNTPDRARRFEAALRAAGKQVDVVYYEGAGHNGLFSNPAQSAAMIAKTAAFVKQLGR